MNLRYRYPLGANGKWCLGKSVLSSEMPLLIPEWPAGMTTDKHKTITYAYFHDLILQRSSADVFTRDTARQALWDKTGFGTDEARNFGFHDPKWIEDLGSHATHPG
jgi:hypothetical protein